MFSLFRMNRLALCVVLALICVTSSSVLRQEEAIQRIKREIPNDGEWPIFLYKITDVNQ